MYALGLHIVGAEDNSKNVKLFIHSKYNHKVQQRKESKEFRRDVGNKELHQARANYICQLFPLPDM